MYAVLGDDVVIMDPDVAAQYKRLVRRLGAEISTTKSLISRNGSLEFASKFFFKGVNVSPISFSLLNAARVGAILPCKKWHNWHGLRLTGCT